ncbi:TolB protein [Algoriphagus locisalis]|uniref:TolB protein n=1 Tax=Algoriphagus locisalis TaxID=305507 RepID=A0A1I6ZSW2_9BACT|nr:fibronectin type III domain-containing protein [Algoriphagus locisalis]SFT65808.1 TolB protein [Algoriphagus locisalis]
MKNFTILVLFLLIFSACENFDDPIPEGSVLEAPMLYSKLVSSDKVELTWLSNQFCAGFCPTTVPATYYEIWTKSLSNSTNYKLAETPAGETTFLVEGLEPGVRQEFFVIAKRADVSNKTNRVMVVPDELPAPNIIFEKDGFDYITHPQISPDGQTIAYSVSVAGATVNPQQIFLFDITNKASSLVLENGAFPSWSASGANLAFVRIDENSSAVKEYTVASDNVKEHARDSFRSYFPVFGAAHSTMLYFLDSLGEGESGIVEFEVTKDTSNMIREEEILGNAPIHLAGMDYSAEDNILAYSLAFPKETSLGFSYDIVGVDPGSPSALSNLEVSDWNDSNPSFSRENSDILAFVSDRSGIPQVWIKNLSSGQLIQVTDFQESEWINTGIVGLSWSGEKLYANTQNSEGNTKLVEINVSALLGD